MSVIILLIAFSLLVAGGFLMAFFWSVKNGQLDDTISPGLRILDDDSIEIKKTINDKNSKHL